MMRFVQWAERVFAAWSAFTFGDIVLREQFKLWDLNGRFWVDSSVLEKMAFFNKWWGLDNLDPQFLGFRSDSSYLRLSLLSSQTFFFTLRANCNRSAVLRSSLVRVLIRFMLMTWSIFILCSTVCDSVHQGISDGRVFFTASCNSDSFSSWFVLRASCFLFVNKRCSIPPNLFFSNVSRTQPTRRYISRDEFTRAMSPTVARGQFSNLFDAMCITFLLFIQHRAVIESVQLKVLNWDTVVGNLLAGRAKEHQFFHWNKQLQYK